MWALGDSEYGGDLITETDHEVWAGSGGRGDGWCFRETCATRRLAKKASEYCGEVFVRNERIMCSLEEARDDGKRITIRNVTSLKERWRYSDDKAIVCETVVVVVEIETMRERATDVPYISTDWSGWNRQPWHLPVMFGCLLSLTFLPCASYDEVFHPHLAPNL